MMVEFHRALARVMRAGDRPPATRAGWERRRRALLAEMRAAAGDLPEEKGPLSPRIIGTLARPGLRIERLTFESRPGVVVPANAYVPTSVKLPVPGVLCVHGHWAHARVDPVVQARCLGLARLGYFVLALDAFGSGERGTTPGVAEYHGGLLGASLWPPGTPLWGLQLYDNIRALDYLTSRAEVDADRIGCTGASGGGNQTMYISAFDGRIRAAAPVCSVGTFDAYLGRACCVDEVMLGALTFCEEGDVLALVAPRALMVVNATRDAPQFSVEEARKSVARARPVFELYGTGERLRHVVVESGHDYNRQMREAMYGWFDRWLRDRGDGSPVPEPEGDLEEPQALRCFPSGERPASVASIVAFAHARSAERVERYRRPSGARTWRLWQERLARDLAEKVLKLPRQERHKADLEAPASAGDERLKPEAGIVLDCALTAPNESSKRQRPVYVVLHPDGRAAVAGLSLCRELEDRGALVMVMDLRGTGASANSADALGEIPDHTLCEGALWVGRPLMGQWVIDVRAALDALERNERVDRKRIHVVGWREAGLLALLAAGLDGRIAGVAAIESLPTLASEHRFHGQRMVVMVPDLLRYADVPQLAALAAPRPVAILNSLRADGAPASARELEALYAWPRAAFRQLGGMDRLRVEAGVSQERLIDLVRTG
jgi:cephalosporin-C deacetylase-like acetyl esterase